MNKPVTSIDTRENTRDTRLKSLRKYLFLLIAPFFYLLQLLLNSQRDWGEFYARHLFPVISAPLVWLSSALPISWLFVSATLVLPLGIIYLFYKIVSIVRVKEGRAQNMRRLAKHLAVILSGLFVVYMLLHGFNYARYPLHQSLGLDSKPRSHEELLETSLWLARSANLEKEGLEKDGLGLLQLREPRSFYLEQAVPGASQMQQGIYIRPKAVPLSQYWSYTNITGMYFPFFAEANVNADIMADEFLFSALHELAHVRGYAREEEANFLAFMYGKDHLLAEYRYAAFESAFIYSYNRLAAADPEMAAQAWHELSADTQADIQARNVYWKAFEGPIEEISTEINDAFLQANLQEAGVESYGMVVDLLLAYYSAEVKP